MGTSGFTVDSRENKNAVFVNKCSTLRRVPGIPDAHFTIYVALRFEIKLTFLKDFQTLMQIFSHF